MVNEDEHINLMLLHGFPNPEYLLYLWHENVKALLFYAMPLYLSIMTEKLVNKFVLYTL